MSITSLNSIREGRQVRVVEIDKRSEKSKKILKHLSSFGIVKGNVIEVVSQQMSGLMILKMNNSTFGISKELADFILVKLV